MNAVSAQSGRRSLLLIFWALMALLALTTGLAYVPMGGYEVIPAYLIAVVKAALVVLFFMEVKAASRLTWVFVGAGFVWLAMLMLLTVGDYLTRGWTPSAEELTQHNAPRMAAPAPEEH
ncbi:MAG TPA: cytochrome C oxidase subunit IV family protein [Phycisphaerae bacterium]|nr:cytochrome C oxidase subunit IV family protein [Phycisphaerales bacterium]HRX84648.1 cytochrome C oxidase subunit IV family protein [Phycisphaerae bacterium]